MKTFEITMTTSYKTVIKVEAEDINDVHDNLASGDYDMELAEAELEFKAMDSRESEYDVTELVFSIESEEDIHVHLNKIGIHRIKTALQSLSPEDFNKLESGETKELCDFLSIYKSVDEDFQTWDIFYTYNDEWHELFSCSEESSVFPDGTLEFDVCEDWTILKAVAKSLKS